MATIASHIYFPFLVLWRVAFRKAKKYLHIKFRPDISIHGQDITTSGCWKQTATIFKFYSRFRRTLHRHRYVILYWRTKFYANWMIADGVMTSYWFCKMAAIASQIHFRFRIYHRHVVFHQRSKISPRHSYDVIAIFKMAAVSHVEFGLR